MSPLYEARYPPGAKVRIKSRTELEAFVQTWKYHNKLTDEHLASAGREVTVRAVGYYHGGDPLYELDGAPGIWHEENIESVT